VQPNRLFGADDTAVLARRRIVDDVAEVWQAGSARNVVASVAGVVLQSAEPLSSAADESLD